MKSIRFIIAALCLSGSLFAQDLTVGSLTVEHRKDPVGIDATQPRLSWKISGPGTGILQTAYSIKVSTTGKNGSSEVIWQTGKVESGESVLVSYKGPALKSGQKYTWQVRVWDNAITNKNLV